jgi:hypothetical protein
MSKVYYVDFSSQIAGTQVGEVISVHLVTGKIEKILLNKVSRNGIEGFELDLNTQPLTFYPYTAIIKIKKYTELK